jgi:hypothetical protein
MSCFRPTLGHSRAKRSKKNGNSVITRPARSSTPVTVASPSQASPPPPLPRFSTPRARLPHYQRRLLLHAEATQPPGGVLHWGDTVRAEHLAALRQDGEALRPTSANRPRRDLAAGGLPHAHHQGTVRPPDRGRIADDPLGEARILVRLLDNWNGRMWWPAPRARAANSTATSPGAITWCRRAMPTFPRTGASTIWLCPPRRTGWAAGSIRRRVSTFISMTMIPGRCSRAGTRSRWRRPRSAARRSKSATAAGQPPPCSGHLKWRLPGAPRHRDGPDLFDGGVDWEGTIVDPVAANILSTLPPAILNYPDYVASGYSPASTAAKNMRDAAIRPI